MDLENFICNFETKLVNVAMRTAEAFYNIFMNLYNKNILKYVEIVGSKPKSLILNIEGRSRVYCNKIHNPQKIWQNVPYKCADTMEGSNVVKYTNIRQKIWQSVPLKCSLKFHSY